MLETTAIGNEGLLVYRFSEVTVVCNFSISIAFSFLMILREDIQHSHTLPGRFNNTRDAEVPWLMKWAVFPYGMDLHLAHHLFSMVPHYRLPELDKLLQTTTPYGQNSFSLTSDWGTGVDQVLYDTSKT